MKLQKRSVWFLIILVSILSLIPFFANESSTQTEARAWAEVKTARGLHIVTFDTLQGRVIVNLPDDLAAGDTISGTVITEPKGSTRALRAKNQAELNGYVIEIEGKKTTLGNSRIVLLVSIHSFKPAGRTVPITLRNEAGTEVGTTTIPLESRPPRTARSPKPKPGDFQLPMMGQQGRSVEIFGSFDGNSANTQLSWSAARGTIQRVGEKTENVSGGLDLIGSPLAESPRKCIFEAPPNGTGPGELVLREGNVVMKGTFRNVGVRLSAPKTNLIRGESTTLTVRVEGLQGIKQDVPLQLVKDGVVSMEGGDVQTVKVTLPILQPDGTFAFTRTITGQQAGAFSVTATVVVFDVCLQDEKSRNSLIFSSDTGDYILCRSGSPVSGTGTVTKEGCIITLQHNTSDRRLWTQSDRCAKTGNATLKSGRGKTTLSINDKDTKNNTCTCQ